MRERGDKAEDWGDMADKSLAKKFDTTPALAFLAVIENAKVPIRTTAIKTMVVESGISKKRVDDAWTSFQKYMLDHPNLTRSGTAAYSWSQEAATATVALQRIAAYSGKKQCPAWLSEALRERIEDALPAVREHSSYANETGALVSGRLADATATAKVFAYIAEMVHGGADGRAILKWCDQQAAETDLVEIGNVGGQIAFDSDVHSSIVGYPSRGDRVEVVRPGYHWTGGDEPVLVLRAVVRAKP
jgi:hypothetical protein